MSALRPSNLPKLAVCPCYESNPVAGPAAERGTLLDTAFRAELLGLEERFTLTNKLTADEIAAVSWSVSMVRAMSGRERVLAREDDCRVKILNLTGTADAIVPGKLTHFDLKTGAQRNYREQMAAYALGLMGRTLPASGPLTCCFATSARSRRTGSPTRRRTPSSIRSSNRSTIRRSNRIPANTAAGAPRPIPVRRGWRWSVRH